MKQDKTEKALNDLIKAARMNGIASERARIMAAVTEQLTATSTVRELELLASVFRIIQSGPKDIP